MDWKAPKDVRGIKSFIGMAGYYWHFIEGFSKIARPMTALLAKEGRVQVDPNVPRIIWDVEAEVDNNTGVGSARCSQAILNILWCFVHRTGMCVDVGRESSGIRVPPIEDSWEELSYSWSGITSRGSCTEDLEALSLWAEVWYLHGPQESQIHIHSVRAKHETTKMTRVDQRLWAGDSLSSRQSKCGCRCSK